MKFIIVAVILLTTMIFMSPLKGSQLSDPDIENIIREQIALHGDIEEAIEPIKNILNGLNLDIHLPGEVTKILDIATEKSTVTAFYLKSGKVVESSAKNVADEARLIKNAWFAGQNPWFMVATFPNGKVSTVIVQARNPHHNP